MHNADDDEQPVDHDDADEPVGHALPTVTKSVERHTFENQFGHMFTITVNLDDPDVLNWWERTDRPYHNSQTAGEWTDMAAQDSDVFQEWAESSGRREMTFVDPPSIRKEPNNSRTLEFWIHMVGRNHDTGATSAVVIKAVQILRTDASSAIIEQDFFFARVLTSADSALEGPEDA